MFGLGTKEPPPLRGAKLLGAIVADCEQQIRALSKSAAQTALAGDMAATAKLLDQKAAVAARLQAMASVQREVCAREQEPALARTRPPVPLAAPLPIERRGGVWYFGGIDVATLTPRGRLWAPFVERFGRTPEEATADPRWNPLEAAAVAAGQE